MRLICILLFLVAGCSSPTLIIPDVVTPYGVPLICKGESTIRAIPEISRYIDAVQYYLEMNHNAPKSLVIVYPSNGLWWTRREKNWRVLREYGGLAHPGKNILRVVWSEKLGPWAYAHEVLHMMGHRHPRFTSEWPDKNVREINSRADKIGIEALKKYRESQKKISKTVGVPPINKNP